MSTDGINILKEKLGNLPTRPGVYRMLNGKGDILYVGKAKNLKNRITSYTQPERMSARIRKMVFETRDLVIVETETEVEALLLEMNLIKSLKPKYNVIFRDDASYIHVLITDEEAPMIRSHRGAKKQKGTYYGPYPSADAVHKTIDLMERAFKLRTCTSSQYNNRTRPCLKYDIKRCAAPCVGKISLPDYAKLVDQARRFLDGKSEDVQKEIQMRMQVASESLDYEVAAEERDRLQALRAVSSNRSTLTHALEHADVFAFVQQGAKACVQGYFYRNGQHIGNKSFFLNVEEEETQDILRTFLGQYYAERLAPQQILTNVNVADAEELEEAFGQSVRYKVRISQPKRGDKLHILEQAEHNARETLQRQMASSTKWEEQMRAFGQLLGLKEMPWRAECFDISNISGKQPVASLVVAGTESMDKKAYRKFAIKGKDTPDDYAMMHEALTRRYKRLLKEESALPSIMMVDGGVGHLNVLVQVMEELALLGTDKCPALTAIAKGEERDKGLEKIFQWREGEIEQLSVEFNSPLIFLLQNIRDEAHRFAIGFHRQKRSANLTASGLDAIPGIGGKRKKALLLHFGSLNGVKTASVEELAKVEGISKAKAEDIYNFFKS